MGKGFLIKSEFLVIKFPLDKSLTGFLKRHDPYVFLKMHDPYGFLKRHDPTLGPLAQSAVKIMF
jgi:hypothetical protein